MTAAMALASWSKMCIRDSNTAVHVNAQTTEMLGDGSKLTGLRFTDRNISDAKDLELGGVCVQRCV